VLRKIYLKSLLGRCQGKKGWRRVHQVCRAALLPSCFTRMLTLITLHACTICSLAIAPGKGTPNGRNSDSIVPNVTEISVGVHYSRSNDVTPSNKDYAQLARITSHVCDKIYRTYFEDIDEVEFLSTDQLPIFAVESTDYVKYKLAAYFNGASHQLPSESDLTDIVVRSLRDGTTFYSYYLFL
jgi:hypothetical protein